MRLLIFSFFTICAIQLQAQQKNIYYPSCFVQYSYQVKDGPLNGDFVSYYENGFIKAKGNFIQGQKQGIWKAWDSNGILRTQRNYRDNYDFDIIAEWTKTGCGIIADELVIRIINSIPLRLLWIKLSTGSDFGKRQYLLPPIQRFIAMNLAIY